MKGSTRPANSGRAKGVPNAWKREIYDDLMARLAAQDFDIVSEFLRVYRSKKTNQENKVRLLLGLSQFLWPRRMAVAVSTRKQVNVSLLDLMKSPEVAKAIETASFALEGAKHAKMLPAPGLPILDGETEDLPDPPRTTGLGL
jgi:hypothetical protein